MIRRQERLPPRPVWPGQDSSTRRLFSRTANSPVTGGFDFGVATELSSAELFSSFVDFAAFMARGEVPRGPSANDDEFEVKATFTLGAGSNGISPVGEEVSLQVG